MKKVTDLGPNECIHVRTPEMTLEEAEAEFKIKIKRG